MGLIKTTTNFLLLMLFTVAIITFAINFGYDNDTSINLDDDSDFSGLKTNIEEETTTFYSNINTSSQAMAESTISTQTEATEGGTSFKTIPLVIYRQLRNVVSAPFAKIFGSGSGFGILLTILIGIIFLTVAMYIYKAWKGNPD